MNNPLLIKKVVIAVVILLLATLYLVFFFPSNRNDLSGNPDKANQVLDDVVKSGVLQNCSKLNGVVVSGSDYKEVCRRNIAFAKAKETSDPSYCKEIADPVYAGECTMGVAINLMRKSGDPGACDQILTGKEALSCKTLYWSDKAVKDSDIEVCGNLQDNNAVLACRSRFNYESFLKSPGSVPCSDIPALFAQECGILKNAIKSKQVGDCMYLSDPAMKARCMQLVGGK